MFGLNPKLSYLIFLVVVVVGLFSYSVQSMRFDLPSGKHRCMAENINKNTMAFGNYSIVNPNVGQPLPVNHTITVQVLIYSPYDSFLLCNGSQLLNYLKFLIFIIAASKIIYMIDCIMLIILKF